MKSLKQYIFEQYSKIKKANKLQEKNGGFMPKNYTVKFLSQLMEYGESGDEMFEDENGDFVRLSDILEKVEDNKCKMQVDFEGGSPMDDEIEVAFYVNNNKCWCSQFIGAWNWDKNESEE